MSAPRHKPSYSQIRIRRYREDGQTRYLVELGFWIDRGTRHVWHREYKTPPAYCDTLAEAKVAATSPPLVAARDRLRARRKEPAATVPYFVGAGGES